MSRSDDQNQAQEQSLLKTQNDLIEAHISLIRMQQQLMGRTHSSLPHEGHLKVVTPPYEEKAELTQKSPAEIGYEGQAPAGQSEAKDSSRGFAASMRDNAVFLGVAGLITVVVLFVSLRPSTNPVVVQNLQKEITSIKDSYEKRLVQESNALTQNQRELENTQKSLKQTLVALENAQKDLQEIRDENAQRAQGVLAPSSFLLPRPNVTAVRSEPANLGSTKTDASSPKSQSGPPVDPVAAVAAEIRKIRSAIVSNIREIFSVQKVYLATDLSFAKLKFDDAVVRKAAVAPSDPDEVENAILDYLSPFARELHQDSRLTSTASAEDLFAMPQPDEAITGSYEDVVRLAALEARRLTDAQKKLTAMQGELLTLQNELRNFYSGQHFGPVATNSEGNSNAELLVAGKVMEGKPTSESAESVIGPTSSKSDPASLEAKNQEIRNEAKKIESRKTDAKNESRPL